MLIIFDIVFILYTADCVVNILVSIDGCLWKRNFHINLS